LRSTSRRWTAPTSLKSSIKTTASCGWRPDCASSPACDRQERA
jgi:hypothetical protein